MDKAPDAYRTISEVAEDLDIAQHVLRFWETRFPQIKPLKRGGGRRYYRPDDVELIKGIRHFLYKEGYTIKGVQRILKEQGPRAVQSVMKAPVPQDWSTEQEATQRFSNESVSLSVLEESTTLPENAVFFPENGTRYHPENQIFQHIERNDAPFVLPLARPAPSHPAVRSEMTLPMLDEVGGKRPAPVQAHVAPIPARPMAVQTPEPAHIVSHFSARSPDFDQGSVRHHASTDTIPPLQPAPAPYRGQVSMFRGGVQAIQARQLAPEHGVASDQPIPARAENTQVRAGNSPVAAFSRAILVEALRDLEECRAIIETVLSRRVIE